MAFAERFLVAARTGQFNKRCVGGLFFLEDFLQHPGSIRVSQQLGPFMQATVRGDFVVLDFLGR